MAKVSLRLRLNILNLLQATASTKMATRPVFGDWEKSKNMLFIPHNSIRESNPVFYVPLHPKPFFCYEISLST
ncbi:hypothetical protein CN271_30840 [Bacillus cereus]|nr:hypothetical protein CON59_05230 [Bacillus cereus]PET42026.1 hypothetical protein CN523_22440 [Bacillus cereus]PEV86018.1 hypothetical protein CN429_05475 [Bacillus cereus]PFA59142.1 hypothetical protein CN389_04500 [Bacillus cereus]PFD56546.1 hypothetical protein CN271_30840 [Bacillus cereus]